LTTAISRRLPVYALFAGIAALVTLLIGQPEPLLVAVPFVVVLAAGLSLGARPAYEARLSPDRTKALEGEEVALTVEVLNMNGVWDFALLPDLPDGLELVRPADAVGLRAGQHGTSTATLRCRRWGAYRAGGGMLQARDLLSSFVHGEPTEAALELRVYPRPERLRAMLTPRKVQPRFGSLASPAAGEGFEFAVIREFGAGDSPRRVNWKVTARCGRLHVNRFHVERSADVVLFIDTFSDVARGDVSTLDHAVRVAYAVSVECLRRRDRVGLIGFGGTLRWLLPAGGMRQLYRIVDALLETELAFSYEWREIRTIPPRTVPAGALVLAITPLVDRRIAGALLDLHDRGHDLAVLEVAPEVVVPPPAGEREKLAYRLWRLHRDVIRHWYLRNGIAVWTSGPGAPLQASLWELQRFRSRSHRVRR